MSRCVTHVYVYDQCMSRYVTHVCFCVGKVPVCGFRLINKLEILCKNNVEEKIFELSDPQTIFEVSASNFIPMIFIMMSIITE